VYCPALSLTTERVFSIQHVTGSLTVTPGSTAPDASLTVPNGALRTCHRGHAGQKRDCGHHSPALSFASYRCLH